MQLKKRIRAGALLLAAALLPILAAGGYAAQETDAPAPAGQTAPAQGTASLSKGPLTLSADEARSMGVNTDRLRLVVILSATVLTAASVSVSGMIGWVGLVIPHLSRRLVGNDCRYFLPMSMVFGAAFLLLVDNLARCLTAVEIPIGILTAFVGAPFFVYLMIRGDDRL